MKASLNITASLAVLAQVAQFAASLGAEAEATTTAMVGEGGQIVDDLTEPSAAPVPTVTIERDATGLRWDERIHSSSKGQTTAGVWKKRKGVDDATVEAVTHQLREADKALNVAPAPVAPAPVAPAPVAPAPVAPAPAPVAPADTADFGQFMSHLSQQMASGKITQERIAATVVEINNAFAPHGISLANITDVAPHPQVITYAIQVFQRDGVW